MGKTGNQKKKKKTDRNKRQRPSISIKPNNDIHTNWGGSFFFIFVSPMELITYQIWFAQIDIQRHFRAVVSNV